ncbi:MAG: nucleotidyltransferase family protein [Angustibacter sp.]
MSVAGVALAAGRGERMRPLTDALPKVLMPLADTTLLDLALDRLAAHVGRGPEHLAVNAHYRADDVSAHVGRRAHVSVEQPEALGTAGALGRLREWLGGRDVLLTNADVYQPSGLAALVEGWDGERCRLLVTPAEPGRRIDFRLPDGTGCRYVGSCLLPWTAVRGLSATPSGLYEVLWRDLDAERRLDLVRTDAVSIDCGTPGDYLAANLHASGGRDVVGAGAVVEGSLERCVVWPGAYVGPDEHLVDTVRAGDRDDPVTVRATVGT